MLSAAAKPTAPPDVIVQWNNVLIEALKQPTSTMPGPGWAARNAAMMHVAMFDAVNAIDGSYNSLIANVTAPKQASIEAAAAAAAHDVLVALYPAQRFAFDAQLIGNLIQIRASAPQKLSGMLLGHQVANQVIAARANDGSAVSVNFVSDGLPGHWEPDPMNPGQTAWGPVWGAVTPFTMTSGQQFRPAAPPDMTSAQYTAAFNEVYSLGAKNSTTRTPEQTQIGLFWSYDVQQTGTPPALYNQILQTISTQQHNTLVQDARLFAMANVAMADGGIACWDGKFEYDLWRPISGIRRANEDGNPDTTADPSWVPLGAPGAGFAPDFTPPFPAYASGHATFGGALFEVLKDFYGSNDIHFTLKSDAVSGVTRSYDHFLDAAAENGISRIYLGIHWNFDATAGQQCGSDIADYVFAHAFTPKAAAAPAPALAAVLAPVASGVTFTPISSDLTAMQELI